MIVQNAYFLSKLVQHLLKKISWTISFLAAAVNGIFRLFLLLTSMLLLCIHGYVAWLNIIVWYTAYCMYVFSMHRSVAGDQLQYGVFARYYVHIYEQGLGKNKSIAFLHLKRKSLRNSAILIEFHSNRRIKQNSFDIHLMLPHICRTRAIRPCWARKSSARSAWGPASPRPGTACQQSRPGTAC